MATVRKIKSEKPYRAGQDVDPLSAYEAKSLYALVRTLNDMPGDFIETRDSEHEDWLRIALGDAIEERCARLVKAIVEHEDRKYATEAAALATPKDGA